MPSLDWACHRYAEFDIGKRCKWLIYKHPVPSIAAYEPDGRGFGFLRARQSHLAALTGSRSLPWREGAACARQLRPSLTNARAYAKPREDRKLATAAPDSPVQTG